MEAWMRAQRDLSGGIFGTGIGKAIEEARQQRDQQIVSTALGFGMAEAGPTRYGRVVRRAVPGTHEFGFGGFAAPTGYALSAAALGLPHDWEGGIPPPISGGGGGGGDLANAIRENTLTQRELAELMRSGQALTVQLDANIDEGIVLRADTVRRQTGQVAARLGNLMVDRVRS